MTNWASSNLKLETYLTGILVESKFDYNTDLAYVKNRNESMAHKNILKYLNRNDLVRCCRDLDKNLICTVQQ